jgi:leucyl/phenylalanyl-tRNA--protein transferase
MVLFPQQLKVSRSLAKTLRNGVFTVTLDTAFAEVIEACSAPRRQPGKHDAEPGTWITEDMKQAYLHLHRLGLAHSAESWYRGELVGGLYGVALGRVFFGESMFTRRSDASKVAFVTLVQQLERWGFAVIDCQIYSQHLESLGAENIPRTVFSALLDQHCQQPGPATPWRFDPPTEPA